MYEDGALDRRITVEFKENDGIIYKGKEFFFGVLIFKDKELTMSKWQWFFVSEDQVPEIYRPIKGYWKPPTASKTIELGLLDEKSEIVALGNSAVTFRTHTPTFISPIAQNWGDIIISPFLSEYPGGWQAIVPPKSGSFTVSVKVVKEDLPRVKSAKLEVFAAPLQ